MSRLAGSESGEKKPKMNKRQKKQQLVAGIIAVILVGAMVFTLIPTFFL